MAKRKAAFLAASVAAIGVSTCSTLALTVGVHTHTFRKNNIAPSAINTSSRFLQQQQQRRHTTLSLHATNPTDDEDSPTPLCDLQTLLRMCDLVDSGGAAKNAIQNSKCILNGSVETRRSKKLFPGDKVTFGPVIDLDVAKEVTQRGYVYKPKVKKVKPLARVDADGNMEFGGRFRSEEWRAERKQKKTDRKIMNKSK
eukprot:CAMPEP_0172310600 /NCGR_PEP_ID=MMETSP1058-20130122/11986_1 /TAXON_ID=83371 /ORGANISM="Detonula confervacea, Strain CCMP 353" /LENGTH=197 /DNA_ID=CAMNT_0013023463 /DNA_START=45 /DNA_END=638 /DNA_ORIENTATION=+